MAWRQQDLLFAVDLLRLNNLSIGPKVRFAVPAAGSARGLKITRQDRFEELVSDSSLLSRA